MPRYALGNLILASDFVEASWPLAPPQAPAHATLTLAAVPARSPEANYLGDLATFTAAGQDNSCHADAHATWFDIAGLGRFWIAAGRDIIVEPDPQAAADTLQSFVTQACLPTLLLQRGCLVLHAGGLRVGQGAVLLLGDSGAGKSSLTAALALAGQPLISDDVCLLHREPWRVFATIPRLRLLPEAFKHLQAKAPAGEADKLYYDKLKAEAPQLAPWVESPLTDIISLAWGENLSLTPLTGAERLRAVLNAAAWVGVNASVDKSQRHFAACAALVREVPVWRLTRPRDWSMMPQVVSHILAQLSGRAEALAVDLSSRA